MRRMHRGGSRGGQGWNQQRHNATPLMSASPLMSSDHLGLQDIDKELELLKRKREIIEQQQKILSNEFRRNEPQFSQGSRFDDYSQLYDDMRSYDHPSRKRPIAVWEEDIPSKRFSGPSRPRARTPPRSGALGSGYQGVLPRQPYRPHKPPHKPPPKTYSNSSTSSKVSKSAPPINKLDTYPVAERKKLIGDATGLSDVAKPKLLKLRADREPSKQMTGRLELALGSIIKDIKSNPEHMNSVKSMAVMRLIKKTVRDRIREVMMDQVVGPGEAIKARYRQVYDVSTDSEIVANALILADTPKIVTPEEYFKNNMNKIVESRLKDMLKKLEEISCGTYGIPSTEDTATEGSKPEDKAKDDNLEAIRNSDTFIALERMVAYKVGVAIKKHIPQIIHVLNLDAKYNQLKTTLSSDTIKKIARQQGNVSQDFSQDIADVSMQSDSANNTNPKSPYKPLPYFAKLMGKPGLPKRNLMQVFFEDYKPKSIKKHRTVHNLLFVGFEDKECFEKLLAADGTRIGKYTLSIRVSERNSPENKPDQNSSVSSEDKVIGAELDEQITELLSSIRKESENNLTEREGDEAPIVREAQSDEITVKNEKNTVEETGKSEQTTVEETGKSEQTTVEETGKSEQTTVEKTVKSEQTTVEETGKSEQTTVEETVKSEQTTVVETGKNEQTTDAKTVKIERTTVEETVNANDKEAENAKNDNQQTVSESSTVKTEKIEENTAPQTDGAVVDNPPKETSNTQDTNGAADGNKEAEEADAVPEIGVQAKGTPVRTSARLAGTPGRVQTRRTSKLLQNDA